MKIGIVGTGVAGLSAAWLLEEGYEVILFEKRERLGGHVHTVFVKEGEKQVALELGFEFFNTRMFPFFCRMLELLDVPINTFSLTYTFYKPHSTQVLVFPLGGHTLSWKTFMPYSLFTLLQFKYVIHKGRTFVKRDLLDVTFEEFVSTLWLTRRFKEDFLYPFLSAGWGALPKDFRYFAAYDVLQWLIHNDPSECQKCYWNEISGGAGEYIKALKEQLITTNIRLSSNISSITYDEKGYIITEKGTDFYVDHLIIATNAAEARVLLRSIAHAQALCTSLGTIKYLQATLAIHGDRSFMPHHEAAWSVANVAYNGTCSALTTYKSWKSLDLFRSWLVPGMALPNPLYALEHFYHAHVDVQYFKVQEEIKRFQGTYNIWLAGIYTQGIDSHESALLSAISIAEKLLPRSQRLKALKS